MTIIDYKCKLLLQITIVILKTEVKFISILGTIFQVSIMASVLTCIILTLRPIVKRVFGINILYFIWILLIIKLIFPYGPETKISIYNLLNKAEISVSYDEKVIKSPSKIISNTNDISIPIKNYSEIQSNIIESPTQKYININQYFNINIILSVIWFIGLLSFLVFAVLSYYKLFNIRKNMICKYERKSFEILDDCLKMLSIKRNIEIFVVETISSPALCGGLNPKILIPKNIFNSISNDELRYIILHELCHYKRKDVILTWIIYLLKSVYWFNPIIFFALNTMREDCEIACDNMVVSKLNRKEILCYGYTIINILSYIGDTNVTLGTTSIISNKKRLKERIKMIGENKKSSIWRIIAGVAVVVILGGITLSSRVDKTEAKLRSEVNNNNLVNKISSESNSTTNINKGKNVTLNTDLTKNTSSELAVNSSINVVIYNSHAEEKYKDGYTIIDASKLLNEKLNSSNINSSFLKCDQAESYIDSYRNSENIIKENIDNYSEAVLVDVHRSNSREDNENKADVEIDLSADSIYYEDNLKFAEDISKELKNKGIKVRIFTYNKGSNYFNLHLSKKSLLINVGDEDMTEDDINDLMDNISEAIITVLK